MLSWSRRTLLLLLLCLAGLLPDGSAVAGLTRREIQDVGFHLVPGARLPGAAILKGLDGRETTLAQALAGKAALLVFTDYRCQSLCGIVLDQLSGILPKVTLELGRDYNVISVALDATQTPADAAVFRDAHTAGTPLHDRGLFYANAAPALAALRESVGLVAPFDAEHHQFAHPAGLVLVDRQGTAQRVLSPFALDPRNLKLALTDGGAAPLSLAAHALLLCYGWDPVAGLYTLRIERVMMLAGAATVALIGSAIALLLYRERRSARPATSQGSRS